MSKLIALKKKIADFKKKSKVFNDILLDLQTQSKFLSLKFPILELPKNTFTQYEKFELNYSKLLTITNKNIFFPLAQEYLAIENALLTYLEILEKHKKNIKFFDKLIIFFRMLSKIYIPALEKEIQTELEAEDLVKKIKYRFYKQKKEL
jgi:hypothetical protein